MSLANLDAESSFTVAVGDRIAQLMIVAAPKVNVAVVDSLDATDRGTGGFGSSGVK